MFAAKCSLLFLVSIVFTPKVMGVAIARYDFSSRDTRELSLQEGDVVKIYSKTGANGWWRGEVNGRVSVRVCVDVFGSILAYCILRIIHCIN